MSGRSVRPVASRLCQFPNSGDRDIAFELRCECCVTAFGRGLMAVGRLIARIQERTILRRLDEALGMPSA